MSAHPSSSSTPHPPVAPTAPQAVHSLANPTPTLVDACLPSYLIPATLALLTQSTTFAVQRQLDAERDAESEDGVVGVDVKGKGKEEVARIVDEQVAKRLERIGLMVGGYVAEKLTLARAPLASHLDVIKFICKDLFLYIYAKQIDNLRTNHRGTFVLQSHAFPPLMSLSSCARATSDLEIARVHLIYPQAIIQGALTRLGMSATVIAESAQLPQCTFQIKTIKSQAPITPSATTANISQAAGTAVTAGTAGAGVGTRASPSGTGLGITGPTGPTS